MANQPNKVKVADKKSGNKGAKFLREVKAELKKVTWPTRKDVISHTIVVVSVVLIIAAFLGLADAIFASVLKLIIK